jgi:hypothetical protein
MSQNDRGVPLYPSSLLSRDAAMDAEQITAWFDVIKGLITIVASVVGGFWVWSRFVLERGLMPPSELNISMRRLGSSGVATLIEIEVGIHNKGASALVVCDLRTRLRYLNKGDEIQVIDDPDKPAYGRVNFLHAHDLKDSDKRKVTEGGDSGSSPLARGEYLLVPYHTFVQPGIEQKYTFVTALPSTALYLLARASFRYQLRPSKTQQKILRVSRKLGMVQYSLNHVREPHTVEKSFKVDEEQPLAE